MALENLLRASLIEWLRADPLLGAINTIEEEAPLAASAPWLGIAASASVDWGCKERAGCETRIALELATRDDRPAADAPVLAAITRRVLALPPLQSGFEIAAIRFLRSRSEARPGNARAALLEFRFRLFEPSSE